MFRGLKGEIAVSLCIIGIFILALAKVEGAAPIAFGVVGTLIAYYANANRRQDDGTAPADPAAPRAAKRAAEPPKLPPSSPSLVPFVAGATLLIALGRVVLGCHELPPSSPATIQTEKALAGAACTAVQAVAKNGAVDTLCANRDEIVALVDFVAHRAAGTQADAGMMARLAPCTVIPGTQVCATNDELRDGIAFLRSHREHGGGS